jgi:biopolymer transport protein ExbD
LVEAGVPLDEQGKPQITDEQMRDLRKINVSADRRLPFETVKKVIYTAGFAGFPDFRLAVLRSSETQILKERQERQPK